MRLDHLLSKEPLVTVWWPPLSRSARSWCWEGELMGGMSTSKWPYQLSSSVPGLVPGGRWGAGRGLFFSTCCFPGAFVAGWGWWWNEEGSWWVDAVRGALLGPEATGPSAVVPFLLVPFWWGCGGRGRSWEGVVSGWFRPFCRWSGRGVPVFRGSGARSASVWDVRVVV